MFDSLIKVSVAALLVYGVGHIAYRLGQESVVVSEPKPEEPAIVPESKPEEPVISSESPQKVSGIGLLLGLKKVVGKPKKSGLKDLLNNPDDLHFESYYEDGALKVIIKKKSA